MSDGGPTVRDRLVGLAVVETIALLIALVSPVTPSRTGRAWSPAELFTPDPSYVQKVAAAFVAVHFVYLVILLLGLVIFVVTRRDGG